MRKFLGWALLGVFAVTLASFGNTAVAKHRCYDDDDDGGRCCRRRRRSRCCAPAPVCAQPRCAPRRCAPRCAPAPTCCAPQPRCYPGCAPGGAPYGTPTPANGGKKAPDVPKNGKEPPPPPKT